MKRLARFVTATSCMRLITAIHPRERNCTAPILLLFSALIVAAPALHAQQTFPHGYLFEDDAEMGGSDLQSQYPGFNYTFTPSKYVGLQPCQSGSGTIGYTTAQPHSGAYSIAVTATTSGFCNFIANFTSSTTLDAAYWVYIPSSFSFTGGPLQISNFGPTANAPQDFTLSGGSYYVSTTCTGVGTHALTKNTWHFVEDEINVTARTRSEYVDGALDSSGSSCANLAASTDFSLGALGVTVSSVSGTLYFDDEAVNGSAIPYASHGLTVRHAPTFGRTALMLMATMYGTSSGDNLVVNVDGTEEAVYPVTGNAMEVPFACCTTYSAGNHTLLVQEVTGTTVNASWSETIKAYNSSFPVSIDAYNNMSVGGTGIFPILPFIAIWQGCTPGNQQYECFWFPNYATVGGWSDDDVSAASTLMTDVSALLTSSGVKSVAPDIASYPQTGCPNCSDGGSWPTTSTNYVTSLVQNSTLNGAGSGVFAWTWVDEPTYNSLDGHNLTSSDVSAWATISHANDPNHLVWLNNQGSKGAYNLYGGWDNLPYGSAPVTAEVWSMDSYPVESTGGASPFNIATWVGQVDLFVRESYGLIPYNFDLEASCSGGCGPGQTASGNQLREEAWLATIHGAKAITWFAGLAGNATTSDQLTGIAAFKTLSQTPSVLAALTSPATTLTVTSNQTAVGARVDAMVKQVGATVTVIAQRLTDIGETDSPLSTTFTIAGCSTTSTATVVNESRSVAVNNCQIADTFNAYDTHVYQFTLGSSSSMPEAPTDLVATVE